MTSHRRLALCAPVLVPAGGTGTFSPYPGKRGYRAVLGMLGGVLLLRRDEDIAPLPLMQSWPSERIHDCDAFDFHIFGSRQVKSFPPDDVFKGVQARIKIAHRKAAGRFVVIILLPALTIAENALRSRWQRR